MTFTDGPDQIDSETLVRRVIEIVTNSRSIPLSSSVRLDSKEEVLELLEDALARFPEELRQARWMLKERSEFLAKTQREADELLEAARVRAERMVQRTEIVRQSQHTATRTVEAANDEARRLRHEAEDYCDQKLANFEIILERTIKTVQGGRQKLSVAPLGGPEAQGPSGLTLADSPGADEAFFDQDQS